MRKCILTMAVIAAASLPSLALADDAKEQKQSAPMAAGAALLSDAEMDNVTAGDRGGVPNYRSNGHADFGQGVRSQAPHGGNAGGVGGNCPNC